ncbi:pectinesterase inhibitor-like [Quercus suber]|uniref:pectinesterase inhibitor-like n=1 Tax=Quercus suber TaxID=58331 RepID=UPI000CE2574E|nr:pectinesterase inhibitor-like [Quercus suber]
MKQIVPSFCSSSSSSLISLLLAIFLCISPTQSRISVKIGSNVLSQICAQTEDPNSCLKDLQSDHRTASTDLYGLAQVSINLANATGNETKTKIKSQLGQTTDPTLYDKYLKCLDSYVNAVSKINYANERWSIKDFLALEAAASDCLIDINSCKDVTPPTSPFLPQQNDKSHLLCNIMSTIAKRLAAGNN